MRPWAHEHGELGPEGRPWGCSGYTLLFLWASVQSGGIPLTALNASEADQANQGDSSLIELNLPTWSEEAKLRIKVQIGRKSRQKGIRSGLFVGKNVYSLSRVL